MGIAKPIASSAMSTQEFGAKLPASQPLLRSKSRAKRLYEEICEQILALARESRLDIGDRLPPERKLAKQLGVSRTSVREALIALETARVIEVRIGSGCYLKTSLERPLPLAGDLSEDPGPGAFEQFQVRLLIEPWVSELASPIISEPVLNQLDSLLDRAAQRIANGEPEGDEDHEFHVLLAEHCGNSLLARLVRELWELRDTEMWRRLRLRVVRPELRLQSLVDRRGIVDACRARNSQAAKSSMKRLLRRAHNWFFVKA